ncbi:hypothetical protein ACFWVF_24440 [Streptomyces sp. NPDC058659]
MGIDHILDHWIPERLLTCVIGDLDTATGRRGWINAATPPRC